RRLITRTVSFAATRRGTTSRPRTPVPPVTRTRATSRLPSWHRRRNRLHALADVVVLRRPSRRFLEPLVGDALRLQDVLRRPADDQLPEPLRDVSRLAQVERVEHRLRVLGLVHRLVLRDVVSPARRGQSSD